MKRNFSLWLAALLAVMLFSCQKDTFFKEDETRISPVSGFASINGFTNSCLDELDTAYVNQVHRVLSQIVYNKSKQLNQDVGVYGTPVWEGTMSYMEDNEMVSVTPLADPNSSSVKSLLMIKAYGNGYAYVFYPRQYAESQTYGEEDFNPLDFFDLCDCYLYCDEGEIELRDNGPGGCFDFNGFKAKWKHFQKWLGGILEEIGDFFGGGSAGGNNSGTFGSGGWGWGGSIGTGPFGGVLDGPSSSTGYSNNGTGGNPNFNFGATFEQIQQMIALLEQFRIDEGISVLSIVLLDLVPAYCADEVGNFNHCALEALKTYIASNTHITETNWNTSSPNRKYLSDIVEFLFENNNSSDAGKTVEVLLDIAAGTETPLTQQQFKELLDAFDLYFDDPENNAEQLVDELMEQNIDPLAVDPAHAQLEGEYNEYDDGAEWGGFTGGNFWGKTTPIRTDLKTRYPSQAQRIDKFFACRILGPALEEAALESLGVPKNTTNFGGAIPDGKKTDYLIEPSLIHNQPFFIEVKGRFGNSFDYSSQWGQFQNYLNYLESHSHLSNSTIQHGLYLIMPSGVGLSQTIKNAASAQNIPLYLSYVELNDNDVNQFRVQSPTLVNFNGLNYSGHAFSWLPGSLLKSAAERRKRYYIGLKYQSTVIDFQKYANIFEASYLIPNVELPCSED